MRTLTHLTLALGVLVSGQVVGQTPTFEAASVKPNTSGDFRVRGGTQGRIYTAVNMPLRRIVATAYEVQLESFRLVGDQALLSDRFDITATFPESATARDVPAMLRALLAERFKLVVHAETREAPIFALVVARRDGQPGPGLHQAALDCVAAQAAGRIIPPPEPDQQPLCESEISDRIRGRGQPLSSLARMLTVFVQRRVEDRTGLSGGFDFELQFEGAAAGPGIDSSGALITALQEQLGLRLESIRAPVEFIVVNGVEAPTAN
jgi:uncharacterized protein (TIGR03435 family)